MRILVLSKRQYTGKDLLDDRYGRLFELPAALTARGHEVRGVALSYRRRPTGRYRWDEYPHLEWHSRNATPFGLLEYRRLLRAQAAQFRPEIIWACADVYQALLGRRLAATLRVPLVVDLYDNYESFGAARVPGILAPFRRTCREAAGLTVVSEALRDYVEETCRPTGLMQVIGNAARVDLFRPLDRTAARVALGLPGDARIIGTAGAIVSGRGISDLFEAFTSMAARDERLWLAYAGPRDHTPRRYRHPRIVDFGVLELAQVPRLVAALDVAVVCNRDSAFGRYCFPLKLHEFIASGTPLVAAAVGDVAHVLAQFPDSLYRPGDVTDLIHRIQRQLEAPAPVVLDQSPTWATRCDELEALFERVLAQRD